MPSNIVMFPGVNNPEAIEHKSSTVTSEAISSIVHILHNNGIKLENNNVELRIAGLIKLLKAIVDEQLGLDSSLKAEIKKLELLVEQDI
jgi:hypothetical protein